MDKGDLLEAFVRKWEPSILKALTTIGEAVLRAGYDATRPDGDLDLPVKIRWLMPTWYHGRPESLASMDMFVSFTIYPLDEDDAFMFLPFIEVFNQEGSFADEINISEPLALEDSMSWQKVMETTRGKGNDVVGILEKHFPKPAKRIWKIHTTAPGNVMRHPSVHTNEALAKEDASIRLTCMLDRISRLFWEFETVRIYSAWTSASCYFFGQIQTFLDKGETWKALRKYHDFLNTMNPQLRDRVTKTVGSITVERLGGYPEEEDD